VLWRHEYACPYELSYGSDRAVLGRQGWPRLHPRRHGRSHLPGSRFGKVVWSLNFRPRTAGPPAIWGFALIRSRRQQAHLSGGRPNGLVCAFHKDTVRKSGRALEQGNGLLPAHDLPDGAET